MTTTNGIVSAVPWSVNYFCSEFPDIPEKSGRRKKTARQLQSVMLYISKRNEKEKVKDKKSVS